MEWLTRALCRDLDPQIFFPEGRQLGRLARGSESRNKDAEQRKVAQKYCSRCSVQTECLEYALEAGSVAQDGVFGGKTEEERRVIIRRRERRNNVA